MSAFCLNSMLVGADRHRALRDHDVAGQLAGLRLVVDVAAVGRVVDRLSLVGGLRVARATSRRAQIAKMAAAQGVPRRLWSGLRFGRACGCSVPRTLAFELQRPGLVVEHEAVGRGLFHAAPRSSPAGRSCTMLLVGTTCRYSVVSVIGPAAASPRLAPGSASRTARTPPSKYAFCRSPETLPLSAATRERGLAGFGLTKQRLVELDGLVVVGVMPRALAAR